MKLHILLTVAIILIANKANCGVIEGVYDKVSNTTQAVKDDVYSWWTYGVDTIMGDKVDADHAITKQTITEGEEPGFISRVYNKVKGGVSSGYKKVHDYVLGKDSDPNKGIIKTLYERAIKKLSEIKSYVFGEHHPQDKPESQSNDEAVNEKVIKLLFDDKTGLFNTENEKQALDTLRKKLTDTGDAVLNLADNEKEIIKKAYDNVRHQSDEFLATAHTSVDNAKNKLSENIDKTQDFIDDASEKLAKGVHSVEERVKKTADDIDKKVQ